LAAKRKLEIANGVDPNAVKAEERRKEASKPPWRPFLIFISDFTAVS
jgi:hypothetical protein